MQIHVRGSRRAWLPALVAAATLAACGGDDGGSVAGVSALAQNQGQAQDQQADGAAQRRVSPSGVPYANPASGGRYKPVISNGQVQPSLSGGTIEENAWVDTPVDSDGDGTKDRIHVRIVRPSETANGARTPVIVLASPYYAGLADSPNHDVDVELDGTPHPVATSAAAGGASARVMAARRSCGYFSSSKRPRWPFMDRRLFHPARLHDRLCGFPWHRRFRRLPDDPHA